MTTTATLTHATLGSVDIPVRGEGGDPLLSRDFGKPHMGFFESGRVDPLPKSDQWNGLENYTISTSLIDSDAYSKAIQLANILKSPTAGQPLTFEPALPAYDSQINAVGAGEQDDALTLTYESGRTDWVGVDLNLTRVSSVLGSDSGQRADTPTASGSGPIEIRGQDTVVELGTGITVERTVGRPNSPLQRQIADNPALIEKRKAATDRFSLNLTFTNNVSSVVDDLLGIFRTRRGRDAVVLDFNGQFGLGAFNVKLDGSGAIRFVDNASEPGIGPVPTIDLRVISTL